MVSIKEDIKEVIRKHSEGAYPLADLAAADILSLLNSKKLFVVEGSFGSFDDYRSYPKKVFLTEYKANLYIERKNNQLERLKNLLIETERKLDNYDDVYDRAERVQFTAYTQLSITYNRLCRIEYKNPYTLREPLELVV